MVFVGFALKVAEAEVAAAAAMERPMNHSSGPRKLTSLKTKRQRRERVTQT